MFFSFDYLFTVYLSSRFPLKNCARVFGVEGMTPIRNFSDWKELASKCHYMFNVRYVVLTRGFSVSDTLTTKDCKDWRKILIDDNIQIDAVSVGSCPNRKSLLWSSNKLSFMYYFCLWPWNDSGYFSHSCFHSLFVK